MAADPRVIAVERVLCMDPAHRDASVHRPEAQRLVRALDHSSDVRLVLTDPGNARLVQAIIEALPTIPSPWLMNLLTGGGDMRQIAERLAEGIRRVP